MEFPYSYGDGSMNYPFFSVTNIKGKLSEKGGNALKKWGQNFLINPNIVSQIIKYTEENLKKDDTIIEIGPGMGVLTYNLVEFENEIFVFEIDPIMIEIIKEYNFEKLKIIDGDVLKNIGIVSNKNNFVVGNLPYYISSEILINLVKEFEYFNGGIFMLQKEFAMRISREISSLSILLGAFGEWKIIQYVNGNNFYPPPKAVSAILTYKPFEKKLVEKKSIVYLERILRGFFWGKRKTLDRLIIDSPFLEGNREYIKLLSKEYNFSGKERPEEIQKNVYYEWANRLALLSSQ